MEITGVTNNQQQYYNAAAKTSTVAKTPAKTTQGAVVEISGQGLEAYNSSKKTASADGTVVVSKADTTESSTESTKKAIDYTAKMSEEDRAELVKQLQADQEQQTQSLLNMVRKALGQQTTSYAMNNSDEDSMWKFLASGNYTVDAATKASAQQAISEDGYYGVKQTSERLFQFASALAGDDVDKMKEMQEAIHKGFNQAGKTWGRELPEISQNTLSAVNQMFDDYYASKGTQE